MSEGVAGKGERALKGGGGKPDLFVTRAGHRFQFERFERGRGSPFGFFIASRPALFERVGGIGRVQGAVRPFVQGSARHERGGRRQLFALARCAPRVARRRAAPAAPRAICRLLSLRPARDGRRLENQIDAAVAAARAHHPIVESRQRHVAPARPDERLHIQLGAIPTLRRRPRVIHSAVDATRVHPPAGRQGVFQGLDRHENIKRTTAASVKPAKVTGDPRRLFARPSRCRAIRAPCPAPRAAPTRRPEARDGVSAGR